jgi:hypothetical protein
VENFFECSNEPLGFIKSWENIEWVLRCIELVNKVLTLLIVQEDLIACCSSS